MVRGLGGARKEQLSFICGAESEKMFSKVSVLIPTRGRVERLKVLLSSFDETVGDSAAVELVFRVDEDDLDTKQFLLGQNVVLGPRYEGYKSMPRFFNELAAAATGDVLMCGNDDMIFRTPGWPELILARANQHPDGLFNIGVMTLNETHYPFSTISKRVFDTLGFLWDPAIFWGDIYLRDVMAWFGRTTMLPEVVIEHDWAGYRPDRIFAETRISKGGCESDPTYWPNVHVPAVNEAVKKLEGLLI